jgi:hypothetical protein
MIIGAVGLGIIFAAVLIKYIISGICPSVDDVKALILIGIAPAIPFCPVFISVWFDKIIELKNGKEKPDEITQSIPPINFENETD